MWWRGRVVDASRFHDCNEPLRPSQFALAIRSGFEGTVDSVAIRFDMGCRRVDDLCLVVLDRFDDQDTCVDGVGFDSGFSLGTKCRVDVCAAPEGASGRRSLGGLYAADATAFAAVLVGANTPDTVAAVPATQSGFLGSASGEATVVDVRQKVVSVCSRFKGWVDIAVSSVFDALGHLQSPHVPSGGGPILGWFAGAIQTAFDIATGVVNGLIDSGRFLVENGIRLAIQPILDQIAKVSAAVAVTSNIVSLLRPWTIRIDASPPQTRKAIGAEGGLPGTIASTVDLGGFDEWPDDIAGCAETAGVTLPPLKPVGAPITWTLTQGPADLVIQDPGTATVLDAVGHAELAYTTGQEDVETAKGDQQTGHLAAHVSIRRKEIADLQQTVSDLLFAQLPSLVRPILSALLLPTITSVRPTKPSPVTSQ